MARVNSALLAVCGLGSAAALIAGGWSGQARAGQTSRRPYIPRPGEIRPLSGVPSAPTSPAQQPAAPPIQNAPPSKQGTLSGEDYNGFQKNGVSTLRDFVYTQDDMKVTGALGQFSSKTKILEGEGRLVLDDTKHHMTGDKARYDTHPDVKLAVFTGNVVIVMKPADKPSGDGATDVDKEKSSGGTAYCDRLDYFKLKDFAVLTGHLKFKQKITKDDGTTGERTLTAEHAEYDGKADKMHLFAPVDVVDTDNQKFHFDHDVLVGTKAGEETVESKGHFTAIINVEEDKDQKAADKTNQTPGPDRGKPTANSGAPADAPKAPAAPGTGTPPPGKNP